MSIRKYIPEFIVLVYVILFLVTKNPKSEWDRVIVSDGKGYYAYLTALFIYNDTDYGFIDKYESAYYPASRQLYKDYRFETGNGIVNKYFPGPAILWLPFFAIGHASAYLFGYQPDGYSFPYQMAIAFAALFYFWLGLLILRKILRFYSDDENAIAWSLLATGLATNLVYYTVNAGCQVHVYNFFLLNGFIYSTLEACKRGKLSGFASAAFLLGMVIISRPQNGIIVLALPFLCGSRESLVLFTKRVVTDIKILIPSLFALSVPLLIPFTYWYAQTGHFLVYSYGSESYDLTNPHLFSFLFSFEKGWMLYTPVAAFSALGLIYLFRKSKWQFFSLATFLFFVVYFLSSWWTWTYTSFVSQRVMIDYYAFITILILFIFNWLKTSRQQYIVRISLGLLIALNIMQHFQHLNWIYPAGPVTAKSYFGNFFSFDKGTTFGIPENEILGKQSYITDLENTDPPFNTKGFLFSMTDQTKKRILVLDSVSNNNTLFIRGMTDYMEAQPLILRVGGFYKPESTDSSLTLIVSIGTYKGKYSVSEHNLMTGLKSGEWKYAEMAIYLPYIRSVSDSLFVSCKNLSKGRVLFENLKIDFIKMQGPARHDWILSADDPVDSIYAFHTDLETQPVSPWSNTASITTQYAFSGSKSSCVQPSAPFSVAFEQDLDSADIRDGYIRVSSLILGDSLADVKLVFDFSSEGKTVFYKVYPVKMSSKNPKWISSEIFREFPVNRLKARKVKIYYWMLKGNNPVYIDDIQIDIARYKPAKPIVTRPFSNNNETESLLSVCCDFEKRCEPQSGYQQETEDAFSGKRVCTINPEHSFSYSHLLPLAAKTNYKDAFLLVTAEIQSDQYATDATLVADFRRNGKTVSYHPVYLHGQTIKGEWSTIESGIKIPKEITTSDSVLLYFYLPKTDEVLMIDDFCVSIKKTSINLSGKKK